MEYDDQLTCLQGGIVLRQADEKLISSARIYPNPASDIATLVYEIYENGEFEIYDALGQLKIMCKLESKNHEYVFDTSGLTSGVYYYKLVSFGGIINTGKLVITK